MDDTGTPKDKDEGSIGTAIKKLLTAGIGAAFLTEEGVRSYVGDLKLPKDVMKLLLQSAQKSKDEITSRVGRELMELLEKVDWSSELEKILKKNRFKISIELEVEPREASNSVSEKKDENGKNID